MTGSDTIREAGRVLSQEFQAVADERKNGLDALMKTCEENGRSRERADLVAYFRHRAIVVHAKHSGGSDVAHNILNMVADCIERCDHHKPAQE